MSLLAEIGCEPATAEDARQFAIVTPGRRLSFPRDHGAHRDFKTEWWYFTGHLTPAKESQARFGFELVFFRIGLPAVQPSRSAWRIESLFLAHFAITDDRKQRFFSAERIKRGSFNDAGASDETLSTWNGDWSAKLEDGVILLQAAAERRTLSLQLKPEKPVVLHGKDGFSKKGPGEGEASYYSSFSRLVGSGVLRLPDQNITIERASVWMDQEFTSSETAEAKIGWDWFALQLDDGSELMLYQLRDKENRPTEFSAGTIVQRNGEIRQLSAEDFRIIVKKHWQSPRTSIRYPAEWLIQLPSLGRTFAVTPTVSDQELVTNSSTGVSYWEGRCTVQAEGLSGNAYVELVGYR